VFVAVLNVVTSTQVNLNERVNSKWVEGQFSMISGEGGDNGVRYC
jgi:hypothetical protein